MQTATKKQLKQGGYEGLTATELLALLEQKDELLQVNHKHLNDKNLIIHEQEKHIRLLEEYLRLATVQKFCASSEKLSFHPDLFDEAELEVALSEFEEQLSDEDRVRPRSKKRKRGFSENLPRVQIRLTLTDEEKAGAVKTFFTKAKEELDIIPAQVKGTGILAGEGCLRTGWPGDHRCGEASCPPFGQVLCQPIPAGPYYCLQVCRRSAAVPPGRHTQALWG